MQKDNWDDLRFVLAVADTGSVGAAARALGVNHATVLRRVAAFEATHGGTVLTRGPSGYEVLPERLPVIEAARLAAAALDQVSGLMRGSPGAERPVRITSTDSLCTTLLPPILAAIMERPDAPRLELRCTNAHRNLGRLEADITVRPTTALPGDLVGIPAGQLDFAIYHARDAKPGSEVWLGLGGPLMGSEAGTWIARARPEIRPVLTADSFMALAALAAKGGGRTILPTFVGDRAPELVRDSAYGVIGVAPLWVASHVQLADAPRLTELRRDLADGLIAAQTAPKDRA